VCPSFSQFLFRFNKKKKNSKKGPSELMKKKKKDRSNEEVVGSCPPKSLRTVTGHRIRDEKFRVIFLA